MKHESVQDLFSRTAAEFGSQTAIDGGAVSVSYAELETKSNRLANFLLDHGAVRGEVVALMAENPIEIVTGILGVLKAGGIFVPLESHFPEKRLEVMIGQVEPKWYVVEGKCLKKLSRLKRRENSSAKVICPGGLNEWVETETGLESLPGYESYEEARRPATGGDPDAACSIYFTSGSTGKPKAILGRLKGIDHFVRWEKEALGVRAGTKVSQLASSSFDGFLKDVFVPLCAGGVVCVPPSREIILQPDRLIEWLNRQEIEILHCMPSVLRSMINAGLEGRFFEAMKYVALAGESLMPADVKRWMDVFGERIRLVNLYGTTETTVCKLFYFVTAADIERRSIPVGKPIPGAEIMILNSGKRRCDVDEVGEIYIRTPYCALGYYGEPELTREVFVQNPFSDDPTDILHKTGDYGRTLESGDLEYLGRRDQQVKVRGLRVELGEIENLLRQHQAVKEVAVIDRTDGEGNTFLCAYLILADGIGADEVRKYLSERLPEAMMPSAMMEIDQMPRTLNGKIDRRSLPVLEDTRGRMGSSESSPRTPVEEIVGGIWSHVLKVPVVDRGDNFFNLGGHSLLVAQVISRIRETLGVELPLRGMFEAPRLEQLARVIEEEIHLGRQQAVCPIQPASRNGSLPLSFSQQRMWFLDQMASGTPAFHILLDVHLQGRLNLEALEQSFGEILRRHEALRTRFPVINGQPVQAVDPARKLAIPLVDLSGLAESEQETETERLAVEESERPFDLASGPPARVSLVRQSARRHTVLCTIHHIVSDGWSKGVVVKEISSLYEAFGEGEPSRLSELPIQYADYAVWQRQMTQGELLASDLEYWKKKLANVPPALGLSTDRPRPPAQTYVGRSQPIKLSERLSGDVKALCRETGVTVFMALLAVFKTLLYRLTGQEEIVVGTSVANRNREELEKLVGFFVNLLALKTYCGGNPRFVRLLEEVRGTTLEAFMRQALPFEKLVEELQPDRNLSHSPLFQVMFSVQNAPIAELKLGELTLNVPGVETRTSKYDLLLDMWEEKDGLAGVLEYNTDLFEQCTAERFIRYFENLVEAVVADPQRRLSQLRLLSEEEERRLLSEWDNSGAEYLKEKRIHELFEEMAETGPDKVAIIRGEQRLSYQDLNRRANRVAHYLRSVNVRTGEIVGLFLEHGPEEIIGILGILKAGAGYLPIDRDLPRQRWLYMLRDAGVKVVLSQNDLAGELAEAGAEVRTIRLDVDWPTIECESGHKIEVETSSKNIAYLIYTSGSTGEPKGVAIAHEALVNYVWWAMNAYLQGESLDFPLYSSLAFDLTVTSIYLPLISGNKLIIYPRVENEVSLLEIFRENQVEILKLTPSHLSLIKDRDNAESRIKRLIVGGEALSRKLAREITESFGGKVEIYNEYGPTEATVGCMIHKYEGRSDKRDTVPIGRAAWNMRTYVLDQWCNPVGENVIGELYVAGKGLAEGYLNRGDLTAARFAPNGVNPERPGTRIYKTGDLVRRLSNGDLEFIDRADDQVKVNGHRIEPGEVEAVLNGHETVSKSVVTVKEEVAGNKRLIAYLIAEPGRDLNVSELKKLIGERLPSYMMPSAIFELETLPLTTNGKVDRQALAKNGDYHAGFEIEYTAPQTEMEQAIAALWHESLRVERAGIYDNFFALGGHSISAAQIIHRINQTFQIDIPLRAIFDEPSIAGLSLLVEERLIERLES